MTAPVDPTAGGSFITIEGPEGAGKTTQAERLETRLRGVGLDVVRTREPGGTPFGERLRTMLLESAADPSRAARDPLADAYLFNAARRQLVRDVIRPALERGATVVCARFADSTLAYQGFGAGLPLADLERLETIATGGLRPDLTILLDLPAETGLGRKVPGDRNRFELELDLDFHRRVRDGFLRLAAGEPQRFAVVDATAEPDAVAEAVWEATARLRGADAPVGEPERPVERIHR